MLKGILGSGTRAVRLCAALLGLACVAAPSSVKAEDGAGSAFSFSGGVDFTSHFISYGVDVWGGGTKASPFNNDRTMFVYGTMTAAVSDQLSLFCNVWSDVNDNTDGDLGGNIQEIDINVGATFTMDKFSFTVANGVWCYASDEELIADFTLAYNDGGQFTGSVGGFSINPSVTFHWRYNGNGGQEEGLCIVPGIKPTFTFGKDGKFPVTVAFPMSVGIFATDDFQGGDETFGFANAGVAVSVPLAFIPEKFGAWSANVSAIGWYTPDDAIPGNPEECFVVTSVGIGFAF